MTALDRLLEALEDLSQGDCPLSDELRQRPSNHSLEALIFDETTKILKAESGLTPCHDGGG